MLLQVETPDLASLSEAIDTSNLDLLDYLQALGILLAAFVLGRVARILTKRLISRTSTDDFLGDLIGRIVGYVIVSFGFVYALESLDIAITPVLGALGIVGFALAFALQDILANFIAGIILQLRRPFTAADQIVAAGHEGTVLRIDARTVVIQTPDGETVLLPSAEVIKNPITNHTSFGARRTTIDIGVAYGTDLDHAKAVAIAAAGKVGGVQQAPQAFVHNFGESSIDIALLFWHEPTIAGRWTIRDQVARSVSREFAANNIEIPFPQRVVHRPANDDVAPD